MAPPAPTLLSTTIACPSSLPSGSATKRARMSALPPAGPATTRRTGLEGQDCAWAPRPSRERAAAASTARREAKMFFMGSPLPGFSLGKPAQQGQREGREEQGLSDDEGHGLDAHGHEFFQVRLHADAGNRPRQEPA